MAAGLGLVGFLDFLSSPKFYILGGYAIPILTFTLVVSILVGIPYSILALMRGIFLSAKLKLVIKSMSKGIVVLLCYLNGLALIVAHMMMPSFMQYFVDFSGVLPWYFYPYLLGIVGIFFLLGLILLSLNKERNDFDFSFIFFIIIGMFILGKIVSFINTNVPPTVIQTNYFERRFLEIMFLPISIVAGWSIAKISSRVVHGARDFQFKKILTSSILVLILMTGLFSSLLSVEVHTLLNHPWVNSEFPAIPTNELEALNFIKNYAPANSYVLTFTDYSKNTLSLAGVRVPYTESPDIINQFFVASEPATFLISIFNLKSVAPTDFVYLHTRDLKVMPSNGFFAKHLMHYLPIAFKNDEVVIYELPNFTPPTSSNLTIVYPTNQIVSDTLYFPLDVLTLSSLDYDIHLFEDPNLFNSLNILLPQDISTHELVDDDQASFWTAYASGSDACMHGSEGTVGTPTISNDNFTVRNGTESLKIVVPSGTSEVAGVFHTFDILQDWSSYDFLSLSLYGQNTMQDVYIYLQAPSTNNEFQFRVTEDWSGWKRLVLALKNANNVGSPDWTKVKGISVFQNATGTWYIDQVMLGNGLGNQSVYENWVEKGGNLIVFNSRGHGDFAKKLSINSNGRALADGFLGQNGRSLQLSASIEITTSSSKDENVSILANYTLYGEPVGPYAYTKKLGRGEIIYVEVSPLFSELERISDEQTKSQLFVKLGSLIDPINLHLPTHLNDAPIYPINFWREANFSGYIKIEAPTFLLQQFTGAKLRLINFTNSKRPVLSGYDETTSILTNVSLSDIEIRGSSTSVIQTTYARKQISSLGLGRYVPLAFEKGLNWTIISSDNATVEMWMEKENTPITLTTQGGTITLSFDKNITYSVLTKTPLLTVTGNAFLERAYFDWPYWSVPIKRYISARSPSTLDGTFGFKIGYADAEYLFLRDFALDGGGKVVGLYQFSEWDIPWMDVLVSPYHIILVVSIIAVLVFSKKKVKTRLRKRYCT